MQNVGFDPETVDFLRNVLDEAWSALPVSKRAATTKSALAERILRRAATGERDPIRLKAAALIAPVSDIA